MALCFHNITTGALLSLGYKFLGSANKQVVALIKAYVQKLKEAKVQNQQTNNLLFHIYTDQTKNLIDRYTQENCLVMCAVALALVMVGTGDVEAFQELRAIRKRLDSENQHYGHLMGINMAIGLLFLGSGAFTLGKSKFALACLMCAFYPIFPKDPSDNRFHL